MTAVTHTAGDGDRDPWESAEQPAGGGPRRTYSAAEVEALTGRAVRLLRELRSTLAEIGARMSALTDDTDEGGGGGDEPAGSGAA